MESVLLENTFLLLGLFLTSGYFLSLILNRFKIPHVVTYLLSGFLIANTFLREINITEEMDTWFHISENLTLGLIGFKIGTELMPKEVIRAFGILKKACAPWASPGAVQTYLVTAFLFNILLLQTQDLVLQKKEKT